MRWLVFWIGLCLGRAFAQKDYFSSTDSMKGLLEIEGELIDIARKTGDMSSLPDYVNEAADPEAYVGNPINAFLLLKRLVIDWKVYESKLGKEVQVKEQISSIFSSNDYPTNEDLTGAAQAFVRLQETYKLDPYDLSQGLIRNTQTTSELSWESCYYLSKILLGLGDHCHAQQWIQVAKSKFLKTSNNNSNQIQILEKFIIITAGINDLDTTLEIVDMILKLEPDHSSAKTTKTMITQLPKNIRELARVKECTRADTIVSTETYEQYQAACRDELSRSPAETRNLTCLYASFNNPFLKLAPFRLEMINYDPFVALFHNVLSDSEIENFHNLGVPELTRSRVGANEQQKRKSIIRTSHGAFLDYNTEPSLKTFLYRLQDLTGQTIRGSERIQFANYGMGGHYHPHFDFFGKNTTQYANFDQGDRISTSMFYLSDVELGGSTAFPFLRINVKPEKGSLLFWFNLHSSGEVDHRTLHAGCPVLLGSKYIVNVWHRLYPQMFYRKCGLTDDSSKSENIAI